MANHVIARRIQLLIQYIYDAHYPSKSNIIEFLKERDFKVSQRTLERDLERIRADYGLEITYNKSKDGYFIDEQESVKVNSFFKFLEIFTVAEIFSDSLNNSNRILEYVDFDDSRSFQGIEHLKLLLIAISQNQRITFEHENYTKNTVTRYTITPLLLKEFENRWYVIGVPGDINDIRTFGIDRVSHLQIRGLSKIDKSQYSKRLAKFDQIVGLNYLDNTPPVEVRLLVNHIHIKYMRSLPLHHSQKIHSENEKGQFFVDFFLIPNYEFTSQILKIGNQVEVIYPEALRVKVADILRKALGRYGDE